MSKAAQQIICLMGPTASGKTDLAIELIKHLPCDIISVDSAMVYRGMDIGTAKPSADVLAIAPHKLIDICDPAESYSAADFCADAKREIEKSFAQNRIPLLVGGTMLYFRALQQGLATLPPANAEIRQQLSELAAQQGWEFLHAKLQQVDPLAASKIHPNDPQRLQRALEVYQLTGKPISQLQKTNSSMPADWEFINVGLLPSDRELLRQRIAKRFHVMLEQGFVAEVEALYQRSDLNAAMPALRSVGYRQIWQYLEDHYNYKEMTEKAIIATQQLAKRQLTWLRSWPAITYFANQGVVSLDPILSFLLNFCRY